MFNKGLILVLLVAACIPLLLARRNNNGDERNHGEKKNNCTGWNYGPCVFKNGVSCGVGKMTKTPMNEDCPVKEKSKHCKVSCPEDSPSGCRYKKQKNAASKAANKASCDPATNKYPVTMKLSRSSPMTCPETKVVYENCKRRRERAANKRIGERREGGKNGGRKQKQDDVVTTTPAAVVSTAVASVECKYKKVKGSKPVCDPATKMKTIVKQLKKNSPSTCEQTKTMTVPCQPAEPKGKKSGRKSQR